MEAEWRALNGWQPGRPAKPDPYPNLQHPPHSPAEGRVVGCTLSAPALFRRCLQPPQPRAVRRHSADRISELAQDAMHTPAHSLRQWLPVGSLPRIRPIVDLTARQLVPADPGLAMSPVPQ